MEERTGGDVGSAKRKRQRYTAAEKLDIINLARTSSFATVHERFGVSRTSVYEWCKAEEDLLQLRRKTKRSSPSMRATEPPEPRPDTANLRASQSAEQSTETTVLTLASAATRIQPSSPAASISSPTTAKNAMPIASLFPDQRQDAGHQQQQDTHPSTVQDKDQSKCLQAVAPRQLSVLAAPHSVSVGFQGECGSFAEIAARRLFKSAHATTMCGYANTVHMLEALSQRDVDYAIVPTEMLFSSYYRAALDRVVMLCFPIVAELIVPETVCICGVPGAELRQVESVLSDLHTFGRYEEYLLRLECEYQKAIIHRRLAWDSAAASRLVHEAQDPTTLALCSHEAARANGLAVLQARLPATTRWTRYSVIGRRGAAALPACAVANSAARRHSTVLVDCRHQSPRFTIFKAFASAGIEVDTLHSCTIEHVTPTQSRATCVVSYHATDAATEATLTNNLNAVGERAIRLGTYWSFSVQEE